MSIFSLTFDKIIYSTEVPEKLESDTTDEDSFFER